MFKVTSYLSFNVPDVRDVLVAKLLDSNAKIKKRKDFTHHLKRIHVTMQHSLTSRQSRIQLLITVITFDNHGRSSQMLIKWGQILSINMLLTRSLHSLDQYHQFYYYYLPLRYQAAIIYHISSAWQTLLPRVCSSDKMIPLHILLCL